MAKDDITNYITTIDDTELFNPIDNTDLFNAFYNFGVTTKEAMNNIINGLFPCYKEDTFSYRNSEGEIVREKIKVPVAAPQKIIPIRCTCCGGKIVKNKCIYCDTEFYVER